MECPRCALPLATEPALHGVVWACPSCHGRAIGVDLLRTLSAPDLITRIWTRTQEEGRPGTKPCPECRHPMLVVVTGPAPDGIELDVCRTCHFIWFDRSEIDRIPRATASEVRARLAQEPPAPRPVPATNILFQPLSTRTYLVLDVLELLTGWIRF